MRAARPFWRIAIGTLVTCLVMLTATAARAQEEERSTKVPLIGNTGPSRQAFSGKVQSVDAKRKLLLVNAVEGSYTEYFPVKQDFLVTTGEGKRIPVQKLEPGTNIIVYYELRKDRRAVTDILILGSGSREKAVETKKPAPSS